MAIPITLNAQDFQQVFNMNPLAAEQVKVVALTRMLEAAVAELESLKKEYAAFRMQLDGGNEQSLKTEEGHHALARA